MNSNNQPQMGHQTLPWGPTKCLYSTYLSIFCNDCFRFHLPETSTIPVFLCSPSKTSLTALEKNFSHTNLNYPDIKHMKPPVSVPILPSSLAMGALSLLWMGSLPKDFSGSINPSFSLSPLSSSLSPSHILHPKKKAKKKKKEMPIIHTSPTANSQRFLLSFVAKFLKSVINIHCRWVPSFSTTWPGFRSPLTKQITLIKVIDDLHVV